jgi:hypothetical protein
MALLLVRGVSRSSGLADVVELVLDRCPVIDAFIRVSLISIEILTVDVRIVVAGVDTFLRFAEATNRLDLYSEEKRGKTLPDLLRATTEHSLRGAARTKTSGFPVRGAGHGSTACCHRTAERTGTEPIGRAARAVVRNTGSSEPPSLGGPCRTRGAR